MRLFAKTDRARAEIDVAAEAMALPAGVRAAAEAIEASVTFRLHFTPAHPLGRLHPAAVEFARLALAAIPQDPAIRRHPARGA